MATTPLASRADVEKAMGRALTSEEALRVEPILTKASELFRLEARQQFTPGESEVEIKSNGGILYLPERPVVAIISVVDECDQPVEYKRRGTSQKLITCLRSDQFAIVHYTHGSAEVPDLVRLTIAEVAQKVLSIPKDAAAGVVQTTETDGPFSESKTYATWAQGGQANLSPADVAIARTFRPKTPRGVIVMRGH